MVDTTHPPPAPFNPFHTPPSCRFFGPGLPVRTAVFVGVWEPLFQRGLPVHFSLACRLLCFSLGNPRPARTSVYVSIPPIPSSSQNPRLSGRPFFRLGRGGIQGGVGDLKGDLREAPPMHVPRLPCVVQRPLCVRWRPVCVRWRPVCVRWRPVCVRWRPLCVRWRTFIKARPLGRPIFPVVPPFHVPPHPPKVVARLIL